MASIRLVLLEKFKQLRAHPFVLVCLLVFSFSKTTALKSEELSEQQINRRISAHLSVNDPHAACQEAYLGLHSYPESKSLHISYLTALAKARDEKAMMQFWQQLSKKYPEESSNREALESLAWAVVENGALSYSPMIRVTAFLGACFSQDIKGVVLLQKGLKDENALVRAAAVKLSSMLLDTSLKQEISHLFYHETVWQVKLEVIRAVGKMQIKELNKPLLKLIEQEDSHAEERAAAIEALVMMSNDGFSKKTLQQLVQSNRAGLRLLTCELIGYFEQLEYVDLLEPLIDDPHVDVRVHFLQLLGRLRVNKVGSRSVLEIAIQRLSDPHPNVAISAAWLLTLNDQKRGQEAFKSLLTHSLKEVRYVVAAALASTGKYGFPLMAKAFQDSADPYVRMNLALGLLGQRTHVEAACDCLFAGMQQKEQWELKEEGQFCILAPSKAKHLEGVANYPEEVNQLARLKILEMLAVMHYPQAQQAIRNFLQERRWGISGFASALLLTEGNEEAIALVKELLNDQEQQIKVQAALILALWGRGEEAVKILETAYSVADRELKEHILEGIGRIGSPSSLPFLTEKLEEPYPSLRIIAAAALLECLYH